MSQEILDSKATAPTAAPRPQRPPIHWPNRYSVRLWAGTALITLMVIATHAETTV